MTGCIESGGEVVALEVGAHRDHPRRGQVQRVQAPPFVGEHGGRVDLEPAHGVGGEAQGPPVVPCAEEHDLFDAAPDGGCNLGVNDPRPQPQVAGANERDNRRRAGDVVVEPLLTVEVAARRGGPRAGGTGALGRRPARRGGRGQAG